MSFRDHILMNIRCRDHGDPLHDVTEARMTQASYVRMSGAQGIFHLESLDELRSLPFVKVMPPLPHHNEANDERPQNIFDLFGSAEEKPVWDYCAEDFDAFGYERKKC